METNKWIKTKIDWKSVGYKNSYTKGTSLKDPSDVDDEWHYIKQYLLIETNVYV